MVKVIQTLLKEIAGILTNSPVFKCHLNTEQPNHLKIKQRVAFLKFGFQLVGTKAIALTLAEPLENRPFENLYKWR